MRFIGGVDVSCSRFDPARRVHAAIVVLEWPSLREVAAKYRGRADASDYFAARLKSGSSGVWGAIPMPAQNLPEAELAAIAAWLAAGAPATK